MCSPIKDFYREKNVLLTGGTGYIGKMIIEKLLRTTEVKNIYLIVRPKEDVGIDKRVSKMFEEQVGVENIRVTFATSTKNNNTLLQNRRKLLPCDVRFAWSYTNRKFCFFSNLDWLNLKTWYTKANALITFLQVLVASFSFFHTKCVL